jgi:GTP-dependent phosphoenolpyruvate carboxykinase
MAALLRVDAEEWKAQLPQFREHLAKFERLPRELHDQLEALEARLDT